MAPIRRSYICIFTMPGAATPPVVASARDAGRVGGRLHGALRVRRKLDQHAYSGSWYDAWKLYGDGYGLYYSHWGCSAGTGDHRPDSQLTERWQQRDEERRQQSGFGTIPHS